MRRRCAQRNDFGAWMPLDWGRPWITFWWTPLFMKPLLRVGCVVALGVLAWALPPALRADGAGTRPIQLETNLEAVIPSQLKSLLLENPEVRFLITVNEEGKLSDYLAIEATHHELLPRAEELLRQAVFAPALDQGKPVQASCEITVRFFDPDQRAYRNGMGPMPFGNTSMEGANRRIYEVSKARFVYRRAETSELDQPVEMRETKVLVMTDAAGQPAAGECVVEYYIDSRGEVRQPRVVKSDNDTVALSALMTLQRTRYAPVTRAGLPAYVKVRQPMSYAPAVAADSKPPGK